MHSIAHVGISHFIQIGMPQTLRSQRAGVEQVLTFVRVTSDKGLILQCKESNSVYLRAVSMEMDIVSSLSYRGGG